MIMKNNRVDYNKINDSIVCWVRLFQNGDAVKDLIYGSNLVMFYLICKAANHFQEKSVGNRG